MSARLIRLVAVIGVVAGLLLGALVYLPRVSGYRSVVPQPRPEAFEVEEPVTTPPNQ